MGMAWLRSVENNLIAAHGCNYYLVCMMVAVGLFLGGLVLDFPRRLIVGLVRKTEMVGGAAE